jgi:hypothetical protein
MFSISQENNIEQDNNEDKNTLYDRWKRYLDDTGPNNVGFVPANRIQSTFIDEELPNDEYINISCTQNRVHAIEMQYDNATTLEKEFNNSNTQTNKEKIFSNVETNNTKYMSILLIIKHMNNVGKYSSTSKLRQALNIEPTIKTIKKRKLTFFTSLIKNQVTRNIIDKQLNDTA